MGGARLSDTDARGVAAWRRTAAAAADPDTLATLLHDTAMVGEDRINAWEVLDRKVICGQATLLMARPEWDSLPLAGVAVGVKDIFDTADFVTAYGSKIYAGHRPSADAAAVTALRVAGAILPGKTVTTEFAYWKAGKTRNPHNPAYSPGGSSAGSAAAVAAGLVPLAIGSQTAASTIRPAAYCGVVGFKPSLHRISLAGVKGLAGSMDTVGCFARNVGDVALLAMVLSGRADWFGAKWRAKRPPALHLSMAPEWDLVAPWMRNAVDAVADTLASAKAQVTRGAVPAAFAPLARVQARIMATEAARDLAPEAWLHRESLSPPLQELIATGQAMSPHQQDADYAARDAAIAQIDTLFAGADILIAPSALDEAPAFEAGTGNPDPCRAWTLLGMPSITLPAGVGPKGLPMGIQLVAPPGQDCDLLAAASWIEAHLEPTRRHASV
jgi:Asp-tRNA(Asn)/Glu-tRNA(Gln) amidotransferase A subunit family amidase